MWLIQKLRHATRVPVGVMPFGRSILFLAPFLAAAAISDFAISGGKDELQPNVIIAVAMDSVVQATRSTPAITADLAQPTIDAGNHSLVLTQGGELLAWGWNKYGQLGDGTTDNRLNPVQVVNDDGKPVAGIHAIAAGLHKYKYWGQVFGLGQITGGKPMKRSRRCCLAISIRIRSESVEQTCCLLTAYLSGAC